MEKWLSTVTDIINLCVNLIYQILERLFLKEWITRNHACKYLKITRERYFKLIFFLAEVVVKWLSTVTDIITLCVNLISQILERLFLKECITRNHACKYLKIIRERYFKLIFFLQDSFI